MRLAEIREAIGGFTVVRDGVFANMGFAVDSCEDMLTFISDPRYSEMVGAGHGISCVLTTEDLCEEMPETVGIAITPDPRMTFFLLHNYLVECTDFYRRPGETRVAKTASVHPSAFVSTRGVSIGDGVVVEANATVLEGVVIEQEAVIRAGVVLGCEGFEFRRQEGGILPVRHAGSVLIRPRAEIQANSCVSRSVFRKPTEIGAESKIDNLVHIAHNVRIGLRCLIAAGVTIGGSARLGDEVWIGPGATISNGVSIGDRAAVTLGSVVLGDVEAGSTVAGNPARAWRFPRG